MKLLMTEGASISARQILFDLGGRHTIDVLDPSPMCQCRFSKFVRKYYRVPSFCADPKGWLAVVGRRLRTGDYDVLLPPHDEVYLLCHVRDTLQNMVHVAIPPLHAVEQIQSKIRFAEICKAIDIPTPDCDVISEKQLDGYTGYPRWLKLAYGSAGQAVKFVANADMAMAALTSMKKGWWSPGTPFLMQQNAVGDQGFVRALFCKGELVTFHCSIMTRRGVGGAAIAKVSVNHPQVGEHMAKLGNYLQWHGVLFCDYFFNKVTGNICFIEANPRIGDSANATFSGNNIIQKWVDVTMGVQPRHSDDIKFDVRSHSRLLVIISKCLDGVNRAELRREIRKLNKSIGEYQGSLDENSRPHIDWLSNLPYKYMCLRLLLDQTFARRYVRRMVSNYSLSEDGANRIRSIANKELVAALAG